MRARHIRTGRAMFLSNCSPLSSEDEIDPVAHLLVGGA
jgi:hypothetical protein